MIDAREAAALQLAGHEKRIRALLPVDSYVAPEAISLIHLRLLAEIALALRNIESAIDTASFEAADRGK